MDGLNWMDLQLAGLAPTPARLVIWSAFAGLLSMSVYGLLSPQRRLADVRSNLARTQQSLDRFDGDLRDALPLLRRLLGLALRQLGLVLGPALLALAPMALLASWLANHYGYDFPRAGEEVTVLTPQPIVGRWLAPAQPAAKPRVELADPRAGTVQQIEVPAPVRVLQKRHNLAEPGAGRLPEDASVERIELQLPQREYLAFGPDWMRGWAFVFFSVLTLVALGIKRAFHIL